MQKMIFTTLKWFDYTIEDFVVKHYGWKGLAKKKCLIGDIATLECRAMIKTFKKRIRTP